MYLYFELNQLSTQFDVPVLNYLACIWFLDILCIWFGICIGPIVFKFQNYIELQCCLTVSKTIVMCLALYN